MCKIFSVVLSKYWKTDRQASETPPNISISHFPGFSEVKRKIVCNAWAEFVRCLETLESTYFLFSFIRPVKSTYFWFLFLFSSVSFEKVRFFFWQKRFNFRRFRQKCDGVVFPPPCSSVSSSHVDLVRRLCKQTNLHLPWCKHNAVWLLTA